MADHDVTVDLRTVQELGGWKELAMVQRYSHQSAAQKAKAVERMLAVAEGPSLAQRKAK